MKFTKQQLDRYQRGIWRKAGYSPHEGQQPVHDSAALVKQIVGGVRAGKSNCTAMELVKYTAIPDGLTWLIGPDYDQVRAEFMYMYEPLQALGLVKSRSIPANGSVSFVTDWGHRVETKSTAQDSTQLASFAPDAIGMVEAAQQPYEVFFKSTERALEKNAPVIMSGTLEQAYIWYTDAFRRWQEPNDEGAQSFSIPSWTNTAIFPGGRDDPAIKRMEATLPEDLFMERVAAVPYFGEGRVHPDYNPAKHVAKLEHKLAYPTEILIDPGYSGAYFVGIGQKIGQLYNVLAEIYMRGAVVQEVIEECRKHPLWPYVREGVIDIAGIQHHAQRSQVEVWADMEPQIALRWSKVGEKDGIDAINFRLKDAPGLDRPYIQFSDALADEGNRSSNGLANGIRAEMVMRRWRAYKEGGSEKRAPIKANDHGCNALGYFIYNYDHLMLDIGKPQQPIYRGYWE